MAQPIPSRLQVAGAASDLRRQFDAQRAACAARGAPDYRERIGALKLLREALLARREDLVQAISDDFGGRAREETLLLEIFPLVDELRHTTRRLKHWMRPRRVVTNWQFTPARSHIVYQPLGVAGIIGAWNYPLYLSLSPLICALAAGNHVMLKPSEFAPHTAQLLSEMIANLFPADYVAVQMGDDAFSAEFAALPFDHLLFTGSTRVGHLVMQAASRNLTPVTLELGGKSPALVHSDFPLELAVRRIMTGKLYNAGQTCIAPDYVLVHEDQRESFLQLAARAIAELYPRLVDNQDYTRIINRRQYERLDALVADAEARGARRTTINPADENCDAENKVFAPALLTNVNDEMNVMREEIFGPILPLVTYRTLDEAIRYINDRARPLALYYFDTAQRRINRVIAGTISGGVTINDCVLHIAQHNLPFGGVGPSGMGQYHGFDGFATFSKKKGVFTQSRFATTGFLRPPYNRLTEVMMKFLIGNK